MAKELNEELDDITLDGVRKELEKSAKKSGNFLSNMPKRKKCFS